MTKAKILVTGACGYHAKTLSSKGKWQPTNAEIYYSAEASLMMAHKWSNPSRVKKLLNNYSIGVESERKAAAEYLKREKEGTLPLPLDPQHKIARFIGDYYSDHRYFIK